MRLLLLSTVFVSMSALSCPNLSGKYSVCSSSTGEETGTTDLIVSQQIQRGATVYSIQSKGLNDAGEVVTTTESYRADGKTVVISETDQDTGMKSEIFTTANCVGTRTLNIRMKVAFDGEEMASVNMNITKVGNALQSKTHTISIGEESIETTICK